MSLLKLRAKVNLSSEEEMEMNQTYDFGNIAKNSEWVWRDIAVPYEQVYKIVEYNKSKSIIHMQDGEMILVAHNFEDVLNAWDKLRKEYGINNDSGEENYEDEDD